jgi:hypothetical protein
MNEQSTNTAERTAWALDVARAVRPYLGSLIGASAAEAVDRALAELIVRTDHEDLVTAILELLAPYPATRAWVSAFYRTGLPPEAIRRMSGAGDLATTERKVKVALAGGRGLDGLAGDPVVVLLPHKYVCPQKNDYNWYRFDGAEQIPVCPTDKVPLVPAPDEIPRTTDQGA